MRGAAAVEEPGAGASAGSGAGPADGSGAGASAGSSAVLMDPMYPAGKRPLQQNLQDRKSTRLNSSHVASSYAVFCLKKKSNQSSNTIEAYSTKFLYLLRQDSISRGH